MDFTFVSGDPSLDFAGTLRYRRDDREESLVAPPDLARWTVAAGLLDAPPAADPESLAEAVELREAIYRLATAARTGSRYPAADLVRLNRTAAEPPAGVRLGADATLRRSGDLQAALATVARAAIELLGSPRAARIRECRAEGCTRLYVDASRGRARHWCDMRGCGNRAKAAGFRARQRSDGT